ncbi:hypothetical protein Taro_048846 [Colocasia esculenta]|uniref:Uncharacterized protein n=1 Tax=Colocasia esculenta TaxID=4460 RepID=A0A843X9A4_COLES|nr:hypothetical protein [Colocasia esculenta]
MARSPYKRDAPTCRVPYLNATGRHVAFRSPQGVPSPSQENEQLIKPPSYAIHSPENRKSHPTFAKNMQPDNPLVFPPLHASFLRREHAKSIEAHGNRRSFLPLAEQNSLQLYSVRVT